MEFVPLVPLRAISYSVLLPHTMIALLYESHGILRFTSSYSYWFNASCRCTWGFIFLGRSNITELHIFWDLPEGCTRFQELRDKLINFGVSKQSFKNDFSDYRALSCWYLEIRYVWGVRFLSVLTHKFPHGLKSVFLQLEEQNSKNIIQSHNHVTSGLVTL